MKRMNTNSLSILCSLLLLLPCAISAGDEEITLLRTIDIPGTQLDRSGLHQEIEPEIRHDQFGGISGLAYTGKDNLYVALPDRGPKDGAVDWTCRFHLMRIDANPSKSVDESFSIEKTILFESAGKRFGGLSTHYQESDSENVRLDPEGIRVDGDGNVWISEEYGPFVLQFSNTGKKLADFDVPAKFNIQKPGPDKAAENANNESGRQGNRGMEGLAISKDGKFLFGLMQSPLLQDCRRNEKGKPKGLNCRLLKMEIKTGATTEYLYRLDNEKNKLNEILNVGDGQFLVIERDGEIGQNAKFKKIMKIDLTDATPIENLDKLPADDLPTGVTAIKKEVLIDLLDPKFGLLGSDMPEKIESLAFGPDLPDGRKLLHVASDNDFDKSWPTKIYCFAIGSKKSELKKVSSR